MLETTGFGLKPFNDSAGRYIGPHVFGHKSPDAKAGELFKPSTDSASRLVEIETKSFSFAVWGSLGGPLQVRVFLLFMATLGRPWTPTHWAILLAQVICGN